MSTNEDLKQLRGSSRRDFIRWSATVAAALGVSRARFLDVLNDTGGTALADSAACTGTAKSVHLVGGNGGFAWFTQLFPYPGVAKGSNGGAAKYAATSAYQDANTDFASVWAPDSPFRTLPKNKQMSIFVAGTNEQHTTVPNSALSLGTNSLLASVAAIQSSTPSLLPVMAINPVSFGSAPGAPAPAIVSNAAGLVDLFNSAASKTLLKDPAEAKIAQAYFSAFSQLNAASARPVVQKTYGTARTAQSLLAKNLSSQLALTAADKARYGIDASMPTSVAEIGKAMATAVKAFALGLTSSLILPAMLDDPHGAFQDATNVAQTIANVKALSKILDTFMADAMAIPDPSGCAGKLGDSIVLTISGDTPKDMTVASAWPDNTAQAHNLLMVYGNGWLKTGWFGDLSNGGALSTWDPDTGATGTGMQTSAQLASSAAAAAAYAVTKGDDRRVQDFGVVAPKGVIIPKTM